MNKKEKLQNIMMTGLLHGYSLTDITMHIYSNLFQKISNLLPTLGIIKIKCSMAPPLRSHSYGQSLQPGFGMGKDL